MATIVCCMRKFQYSTAVRAEMSPPSRKCIFRSRIDLMKRTLLLPLMAAAAFGIARSEGEKLMRSPSSLTRRQRSLLAQYLEMGEDSDVADRRRSIAAKLRESIAAEDRRNETDQPSADATR